MKKTVGLLAGLLLLTGCTSAASKDSDEIVSFKPPLMIQNAQQELIFQAPPQKVITMGPNTSELFCALGLEETIIGNTLDNHSRAPLTEFQAAYAKIPELTYGSATREAVLASGADFIYGIDWEFGAEGLEPTELGEYGITVYQNQARTIPEVYQEIIDIGQIFDVEERAQAFIKEQKQRLQQVAADSSEEPVRVFVYDNGQSGIFSASGSNFESRLIEAAGGYNIFNEQTTKDWITVSVEEVLKRDPQVIIVHDYDQPAVEQKIVQIKADPVLAQLSAVQAEHFVTLTLESALPGPRTAYTVERLAAAFQKVAKSSDIE